jgi:hypothetical protein
MAEPDDEPRPISVIALSLSMNEADAAVERALVLSVALVPGESRGRDALGNAQQALRAARTLLQDELKGE